MRWTRLFGGCWFGMDHAALAVGVNDTTVVQTPREV